ncbi:MAG: heavy metal translocating P-type ATPase [Planctomycetota bacterium]
MSAVATNGLATNGFADEVIADAVLCDHCGLHVPDALVDPDADRQFCCGGCRVAYDTIHGSGLAGYYAVRDQMADDRRPASGRGKRYAPFDAEAFAARHVGRTAGGYATIDLQLEGVHCAACVWLVERLPRVTPGVVEANLSLGSGRARLVWDADAIPLSSIAETLDRLGYAPHPARDAAARDRHAEAERRRLVRMAVAGALAGNSMLIALALYAGVFDGIEASYERLFRWLSMALGLASLFGPGRTFFQRAAMAVRTRVVNLDLPIALALAVGAVAGTANVLLDRGDVYFDSLSVLVFLLLVGRFLQARQQRWATEAVGLAGAMTPDACRVVRGGEVTDEPIEALAVGDTVEVRAGELLPADGRVAEGVSSIDQSLLMGESIPRPVSPGDDVAAGGQNLSGTLRVEVTAVGDETRVGRLMRLVAEALHAKPGIVRFADRVAGWFVAVIVTVAAANFAAWTATAGLAGAIDSTVALLIVACPCALGLATPLTMAMALGRASRDGMLVKSADVLERLGRRSNAGRLFLDKTGTLTAGRPSVVEWVGEARVADWVAAMERESVHPVASALVTHGDPTRRRVEDRQEHAGRGVTGVIDGRERLVGSPAFARSSGVVVEPRLRLAIEDGVARGLTAVVAATGGHAVAVALLSDNVQADAADAVDWLSQRGWRLGVLSGDARGPVERVAGRLGIAEAAAEVTPEGKLDAIRAATESNDGTVVMIGDGVNDAAALAAADVGVAVHGGAEASLVAADVYLTEPGLGKVVELMRLARRTMRVARRNLVISLAYNTVAVALAAAGCVTPLVAAVLMPLSSASVLASAIGGLSGVSDPDRRRGD